MIRGLAEAIGWFIFISAIANVAGLVEFRLYLSAPSTTQCPKEQPVQLETTTDVPSLDLVTDRRFFVAKLNKPKRDAKKLTKTQPLTHTQALELLVKQEGFKSYAAMRAALKDAIT